MIAVVEPHGAVLVDRAMRKWRREALRQLSLLALQHQYAGADAANVSQRVRKGARGFGV